MTCRSVGQLPYQFVQSVQRPSTIEQILRVDRVGNRLEIVRREEDWRVRLRSNRMRRGNVVAHTVDPRPHRTATIEAGKAAPQGDVDLLKQVPVLVGIPLIRARQALQRAAIFDGDLGVQTLRASNRARHSLQIVADGRTFLQRLGVYDKLRR